MKHEDLNWFVKHVLSSRLSEEKVSGIQSVFGYGGLVLGMAMSCLLMGASVGFSEEQPQELPKPFHKTTPPLLDRKSVV